MKDRCVIIGAAPVDDYSTAPAILPEDLVLCADGGLRHCIALEIQPDLVIGDFDSLEDRSLLAGYPCLELPVEKDDTDTMFAVKYGIDRGYRDFLIYGGIGGRLDHTFANLSSLLYIAQRGGKGLLTDGRLSMTVITGGTFPLDGCKGRRLSLFPFGCEKCIVSETGVHYPLERGELNASFPLGVSNYVEEENGAITLYEGALLIILEKI